jgi:hypothetical protein
MAIPELERERAERALRRLCDKVPTHIRDQLEHDFRIARSDIALFERRGPARRMSPVSRGILKADDL